MQRTGSSGLPNVGQGRAGGHQVGSLGGVNRGLAPPTGAGAEMGALRLPWQQPAHLSAAAWRRPAQGRAAAPVWGMGSGGIPTSYQQASYRQTSYQQASYQQASYQQTSYQQALGLSAMRTRSRPVSAQAAIANIARGLMDQPSPNAPQRLIAPIARLDLALVPVGDGGPLQVACIMTGGPFDSLELVIEIDGGGVVQNRTIRRLVVIDTTRPSQGFWFMMPNPGLSSMRLIAVCRHLRVTSAPVAVTFDPKVQVRDGGGPAKKLLSGNQVLLIPPSWAGGKEENYQNTTLTLDLIKLLKLANGGALPGGSSNASPAQVEAWMASAIDQAIKEFSLLSAVKAQIPLIAQAAAAVGGVNALRKWVTSNWRVYKIKDHIQMLESVPAASGRRPTVHAATGGLTQYQTHLGHTYLAKAAAKTTEVAVRFIPGSSVVVGAVVNGASVVLRILKNYEEARLAERTNQHLIECARTQLPALYYHTIRHGHVAVLCHVLAGYSEAQILDLDRRSRMILGNHVPIEGLLARAWDALKKIGTPPTETQKVVDAAKAAAELKTRAKTVQDNLRYAMAALHAPSAPQAPQPEGVRSRNR
jgi:hypothetical protein